MKRKATYSGNSKTRSRYTTAVAAANTIGRAYKVYSGWARNRTRTKSAKGSGSNGITTYQKDYRQLYQYRRAPAKKRRIWKSKRKNFISNQLRELASRKYHFSGNNVWSTAVNAQGFFGFTLYGANGYGGTDGTGDLANIYSRMDTENRTLGTGADQSQGGANARRLYVDEARLRTVFTNTGSQPCFFEIYTCRARKDVPLTSEGNTLAQFFTRCAQSQFQANEQNSTGQAGLPDTGRQISGVGLPAVTTTGVTPFEYRHFCQNFKIMKVQRIQLAPGNTFTFDQKRRRNLRINWDDYNQLLFKRGVTELFLVRQWGTVENVGGVPENNVSSVVCEVERDYNCKILDTHLPELNYQTYTNSAPVT